MILGKPWTDEENNRTYFRSADFQKFLQQQRFLGFDGRRLWNSLRNLGAEHHQFFERGKNIQCWSIPKFSEQTEGFEIPKIQNHEESF